MRQGALILDSPKAIDNPFFLLFPQWGRVPMVLFASVVAVIASQAVIAGASSWLTGSRGHWRCTGWPRRRQAVR